MTKITAVLVHYHTPDLAAESVRALRDDAEGSEIALEITLVDNGSLPADRSRLRALEVDSFLDPGTNLGYAAGANRVLAEVRSELAIVLNPDVAVLPGCVTSFVHELESGTAAVGPRLFWDRARAFLLPPTERSDRVSALLAVLATRSRFWAGVARRRWRRHARRHWEAATPLVTWDLSGAILGFRMDAWHRVGPFDEGYRLYFEETDWLLRLRREGLRAKLLPRAEAIHLYAQASRNEASANQWFEESAHRFRRKYYGALFCRLLERLASGGTERDIGAGDRCRGKSLGAIEASTSDLLSAARWIEISASPAGFPAAAHRLEEKDMLEGSSVVETVRRLTDDLDLDQQMHLTVIDADEREICGFCAAAQKRSPSPLV